MACYGYKTQGNNKPSSAEKQQEESSSFAALETKKKNREKEKERAACLRENKKKKPLMALCKENKDRVRMKATFRWSCFKTETRANPWPVGFLKNREIERG